MTASTDTRAARLAYASDSFLARIVETDHLGYGAQARAEQEQRRQFAEREARRQHSVNAQALAVHLAQLRLAERDARQAIAAV